MVDFKEEPKPPQKVPQIIEKPKEQISEPILKPKIEEIKEKPKPIEKPKIVEKEKPKVVEEKVVIKQKTIIEPKIEELKEKPKEEINKIENLKQEEPKTKNLSSFLSKKESVETQSKNDKEIKALYQDEFFSLSKEEQEFIKENLDDIGRVTQKYLKYPDFAGATGQSGVNILEFFLHPNGDITDLKIINSSGYNTLDKNSIETVEVAYKEYPRPQVKTKIRIYVNYRLY